MEEYKTWTPITYWTMSKPQLPQVITEDMVGQAYLPTDSEFLCDLSLLWGASEEEDGGSRGRYV